MLSYLSAFDKPVSVGCQAITGINIKQANVSQKA